MKSIKICILSFFMVSISCNIDRSIVPRNIDSISPMSVGNSWTYVDSTFRDSTIEIDTVKFGICGTINLTNNTEKKDYFIWSQYNMETNNPEDIKWIRQNESDGLWTYGVFSNNDTLLISHLKIKYPVTIGDKWDSYLYLIGRTIQIIDTFYVECVAKNVEFKTLNKTYSCIVYKPNYDDSFKKNIAKVLLENQNTTTFLNMDIEQIDNLDNGRYHYYSKGVGLVGIVGTYDNEIKFKRFLLSKNLN